MNKVSLTSLSPEKLYLELPLYEEQTIPAGESDVANAILGYAGPMDAYCPGCGGHSIFRRNVESIPYGDRWLSIGRVGAIFTCTRDAEHQLYFILSVNKKSRTIQKIGQFPSLATLSMYDVKKYAPVLEKATFRELTKAIGLAAHGVGVGSFVYLRRIFEGLVEEAHAVASSQQGWDEAAFTASRMGEKIQLLANYLPPFLVDNRTIYGILSKGIHELSEEECLAAFPVVKLGIEIILDAKLEFESKRKKIAAATQAIQQLASKQGGNAPVGNS